MSSLNRFMLAFNEKLSQDVVSIDAFTNYEGKDKTGMIDRYIDRIIEGDYLQLYSKASMKAITKSFRIEV